MMKADIGLIGLGVMGENLVLNIESRGYRVAVFNRTTQKVINFINSRGKGKNIIDCYSIEELVKQLKKPRKIMIIIQAGNAVDSIINQLIPFLEEEDIIIDGGNSNFKDTIRRFKYIEGKGLFFIGTGISGGEQGALKGPSIMPGGSEKAWPAVRDIFQKISAKVNDKIPCCEWIGKDGAGHFVKMVHNGIEYGDMQIICEAFHFMKDILSLDYNEMHRIFKKWNNEELNSYLIEITSKILAYKDKDGDYLVEKIIDKAEQKGTGKWTVINALDLEIPLPLIAESVFARNLSSKKTERVYANKLLTGPKVNIKIDKNNLINDLKNAVYMAKIISYAQGFALMKEASNRNKWNLNLDKIALIWRGGCIIRSKFLENIEEAYDHNPELTNLLLEPFFKDAVIKAQSGLRNILNKAILYGIPVPAMSSALSYYDGYRSKRLPANLLQAQRDYFGGHTYHRIDKPLDKSFHTNWTGEGGDTTTTNYKT